MNSLIRFYEDEQFKPHEEIERKLLKLAKNGYPEAFDTTVRDCVVEWLDDLKKN